MNCKKCNINEIVSTTGLCYKCLIEAATISTILTGYGTQVIVHRNFFQDKKVEDINNKNKCMHQKR